MIDLSIQTESAQATAEVRGLSVEVMSAISKGLHELVQTLRTDIVTNRLYKPRTGGGKIYVNPWTRKEYAEWRKGKTREQISNGRDAAFRQHSGPPAYPQVLSVFHGRLRQGIDVEVSSGRDFVVGTVGTRVEHGAIHELAGKGREWLRPAWRDMESTAVDDYVKTVNRELSK